MNYEEYRMMEEKWIEALEENTKLKAEIEQLSGELSEWKDMYENHINWYKKEIKQLKSELEQSVKLPCNVGDEFYCIAYSDNSIVIKVFCDGYGVIKNNLTEPEQRFLWMTNTDNQHDYWKIDFSIFNEKMFKTQEEAEQALKGRVKE